MSRMIAAGRKRDSACRASRRLRAASVWNGDPFSVYAKAERVYIDGALVFDRNDRTHQPVSDFMLGQGAAAQGGVL